MLVHQGAKLILVIIAVRQRLSKSILNHIFILVYTYQKLKMS